MQKEEYGENQYGFWLYRLTSPSGKKYYGLTKDYKSRFAQHNKRAENGSRSRLCSAIRKYGWATFTKEILCNATLNIVKQLERSAISVDNTFHPGGYNMTAGGDGVHGYKHTDEVKVRWSEIRRGKKAADGVGAKIGAALRGRKRPPEVGQKISIALKGRTYSAETLARMSDGQRKRFSNESSRNDLSAAQRRGWAEKKRNS